MIVFIGHVQYSNYALLEGKRSKVQLHVKAGQRQVTITLYKRETTCRKKLLSYLPKRKVSCTANSRLCSCPPEVVDCLETQLAKGGMCNEHMLHNQLSFCRLRHLRTHSALCRSSSAVSGVYRTLPYQPLSDEPRFTPPDSLQRCSEQ